MRHSHCLGPVVLPNMWHASHWKHTFAKPTIKLSITYLRKTTYLLKTLPVIPKSQLDAAFSSSFLRVARMVSLLTPVTDGGIKQVVVSNRGGSKLILGWSTRTGMRGKKTLSRGSWWICSHHWNSWLAPKRAVLHLINITTTCTFLVGMSFVSGLRKGYGFQTKWKTDGWGS